MSNLLKKGVTTLVTTHHPDLKAYAHSTPGVINASVEFDLESLKPTYHLTVGLPGRSNALAIASRLGLPDEIVQSARGTLDPADLQVDDLLDDIHRQRRLGEEARQAAENALQEAEQLRVQLVDRLEEVEEERISELEKARRDNKSAIRDIQDELKVIKKELKKGGDQKDQIKQLDEKTDEVSEEVTRSVPRKKTKLKLPKPSGPIKEGDCVYLRSLGKKGMVLSVNGDDVEIQVGVIRVRAQKADLEHSLDSDTPQVEVKPKVMVRTPKDIESPGTELDLRGQQVDEAIENLEYYLDKAFLAGLPWVRIIHGMGMGRLRSAVRDLLKDHPQIKSFEPGKEGEGGDGVTVVSFLE
jgi:DNA mismatch repair protein MutS2